MRSRGLVAVLAIAAVMATVPIGAGADLGFNGTIEGQVTLWGTGEPVEGAEVRGNYEFGFVSAITDANGHYQLANLEAGNYSVGFLRNDISDPFVWYDEVLTITDDEVFNGIDGMVQDAGTMIGRAVSKATGDPIAGICADVYDSSDTLIGTAESNAGGWLLYPAITVTLADSWSSSKARVYDCNDLGYAERWHFGLVEYLSERGRFESELAPPGEIVGTVTGPFGSPLNGICVSLWQGATHLEDELTDSEGWYDFSGLTDGGYELDFEDCNDPVNYEPEWDVPVVVVGGEATYHDQSLEFASTITGVVTDASTGLPLQGICVIGTEEWFMGSRFWFELTDALGRYTLVVPTESEHQYVRAYWCGEGPAQYGEQWWDGAGSFEEATDLAMTLPGHRTGVDIAMPKMASLQGTLTGADGLPAETYILLEPQFEPNGYVPFGTSNTDGTYRLDNIEPGEYLVSFGSDNPPSTYALEWYDDATEKADATPVVFEAADVITIDAELDQVGVVEWDFVVDWEAFPTMCAYLSDEYGDTVATLSDRAEDHFEIGGLAAGDYLLYAEDCDTTDPDVAPVWYPDATTRSEATMLSVDGDVTDLGDWFLSGDVPGPSTVEGSVSWGGTPFDACVTVFDEDFAIVEETVAVAGSYSATGLTLHGPTAALHVKAEDCGDSATEGWYGGTTQVDALAIPFGLGMDWAGIDIDLPGEPPLPPSNTFTDDDGSVFEADIEWLAAEGVTRGCNPPVNDEFCPNAAVTRGQMAAFLVRALGLTDQLDDPFIDDDGSVFEADIEKLAAAGITRGCNPPANDSFCPNDPVTRGQMAAFLVRALSYTDAGEGDLFTDDDGSIFEDAIDKLATAGVTRGCNPPTNDRFCPGDVVTRGQMAAFLHRALG